MIQIAKRLEANGVCKAADFIDMTQTYDFSYYSLVGALSQNANRCFRLEGYLYPATYEFYKNEKPQDAVGRFLRVSESRITADDRARAQELGMSVDQILTLASIIEKECGSAAEMKNVSSVFHNRLDAGMKLQSDATIYYCEVYIEPNITGNTERFNAYYNTYKCAALPSGPICNPGRNAIQAALYPADTPYYYFLSDANGKYYYAETYAQHQQNGKEAGVEVE